MVFMFGKDERDKFRVNLTDPYENSNILVLNQIDPISTMIGKTEVSSIDLTYKGNDKAIQLRTVEIKSTNDTELYGLGNKCGDYICKYNILNCPNHPPGPGSKIPIKGKNYISIISNGRYRSERSVVYKGCILEDVQVSYYGMLSRQIAKEFYIYDYNDGANPDLDFQSTVYWTPFLQLSSSKDTEVSFYTSDLKAPYKIIVQGLSEKQVVTGATIFKVE